MPFQGSGPMAGSSCSPGHGEVTVMITHHSQARASCMTLTERGSHSASELVVLTAKLPRFMDLC
jgi:hypothetical protein